MCSGSGHTKVWLASGKGKEGADASLFYYFFLRYGLEWRVGAVQAEVGHGEIPERLIDLVKKNKGIQAPAPPCSTWACGIEAVTVKFAVRRSKKKFLHDS